MAESAGITDTIAATAEQCLEVLLDFESYPEWQGGVMSCEVLERDEQGRGSLIAMQVDAKIKKVSFQVRYHYDGPTGLHWTYVSGDLQDNAGRYQFSDNGDGTTEVTCDIAFEIGFFVPGPLKNMIKDQGVKNSMRDLKLRVEKLVKA